MSLSQQQLESMLWGVAEFLCGQIDASDYKQYIFPLLFYKRLSDVYRDELNEALEFSGGDKEFAEMPEQHRFVIPESARREKLREISTNIGAFIQKALRIIEKNNQRLYGVFGDAQWTNKKRLPDHLLSSLVEHFSKIPLGIKTVAEDDLGAAYEYLIKKFADDSGHTVAEFYTNRTVVHLMTRVPLYVHNGFNGDDQSLESTIEEWQVGCVELKKQFKKLFTALAEIGIEV